MNVLTHILELVDIVLAVIVCRGCIKNWKGKG